MAVVPASCLRCGGVAGRGFSASDRNRCVTPDRFEYARCATCDVVWMTSVPDDPGTLYPADYHTAMEPLDLAAAIAAEAPRVGLLTAHLDTGQLVEIGPSRGVFAAAAKAAGFDVVGLELDAECCRHLEAEVGVRAINTAAPERVLPDLPRSAAVVMWHVIEHVPDPWALLRVSSANLEPGGILALATPNPDSLQFRLLKGRWLHADVPRHLTLIPLATLREEVAGHGLELLGATTNDPVGLLLNEMGWQRSFVSPPAQRPDVRLAWTVGKVLATALGPIERRGMRGAAYTAVFRKREG